jgi:glycine hydroxymethyltransferase
MKESDMKEVAKFIKKVVIDKKDKKKITLDVKKFRKEFQKVRYCFESKHGGYDYIKIR